MAASNLKGKEPTAKQKDASKKAVLLEGIDKQYNDDVVLPKSKVKAKEQGSAFKKLKKGAANTRFSMIKLTSLTSVEDFKKELDKVLKVLDDDTFKKGKPMFDLPKMRKTFPHDWEDIGCDDWVDPSMIDLNDMVKVGANLRRVLLGMTFSLSGFADGSEYKNLLVSSYMAINTALFEYKNNLNSCMSLLVDEISWRSEESGDCMTNAGGKGFRNTRDRLKINFKTITDHNKLVDKVLLAITAKNFTNMLTVISKSGIRHGSTVANSHRAQMNKMMDKFDGIVSTMNEDFENRLTELNKSWEMKYNSMETRLNKEITRLEGVIEESQRLNKEYASNLDSLLTRVEGLNINTSEEQNRANKNKRNSKALFDQNDVLAENFKNNEKIIQATDGSDLNKGSDGIPNARIAMAVGGLSLITAGAAALYLKKGKDEDLKNKKGRYGR